MSRGRQWISNSLSTGREDHEWSAHVLNRTAEGFTARSTVLRKRVSGEAQRIMRTTGPHKTPEANCQMEEK